MKFGDRVFYPSGIMGKKVQWKRNAQLFEMWKGKVKEIVIGILVYGVGDLSS